MDIDSLRTISDTLNVCVVDCEASCLTTASCSSGVILDWCCKIATVVIAVFNIIYAIKLDLFKNKKDKEKEERDRKLDWMKTIVYNDNLYVLYKFFSDLNSTLFKLKSKDSDKKAIEIEIQNEFFALSSDFIIYLKAADNSLGASIQRICDNLRDLLVEKIGDEGINLYVEKTYNDNIKNPYDEFRIDVIKQLFNYKG